MCLDGAVLLKSQFSFLSVLFKSFFMRLTKFVGKILTAVSYHCFSSQNLVI